MPCSILRRWRIAALTIPALALAAVSPCATPASADPATLKSVPGKPALLVGAFDLATLGYRMDESFLSGTATSYALVAKPTIDGDLRVKPASTAPFATRMVVIRPTDSAKFNGTVLVEWLNVTAGQDTPADWMVAHREMLRRGFAYVAVSAQSVGVEGGNSVMGMGTPLKKADPARYGALSHPGDAWSFDIFSQAGAAVKAARGNGLLGDLMPERVIALGESQSAVFLTTYVDAVDRVAAVYDGFLIHSRFGGGASLSGIGLRDPRNATDPSAMPPQLRFRRDMRVPLLCLITETDLMGAGLTGYGASRVADGRNLRVWELAGAAHADGYLFGGAFVDSGSLPVERLAKVFVPSTASPAGKFARPFNAGMPHHYVLEAAIAAIDRWVRTGRPPAPTATLTLAGGALVPDANGVAQGGVRTPWTDVPTMRLSGLGNAGNFTAQLVGVSEPYDAARLAALYPGGKPDYLRHFTAALDRAIARGHIVAADRSEILAIAAINYPE